jgi:hypothetical protein
MALDPRIDSLAQYAMSELAPGATDETAQLRERVENLERVVGALLRTPNVQVIAGPPTVPARDGTMAIDSTNLRLYVRVASAWRFLGPFT